MKEISKLVEVGITPTPEDLAECFWDMTSDDQCEFFSFLYKISGHKLAHQMQSVVDDDKFSVDARMAVDCIAQYASTQKTLSLSEFIEHNNNDKGDIFNWLETNGYILTKS